MLIGQATLKSAAFCPRLTMLLNDLQGAGYTVWLEGLSVRFDGAPAPTAAQSRELDALMQRYSDLVVWLPEPRAELAEVLAKPGRATPKAAPRWRPRLFRHAHDHEVELP
jgi:hypothetical protein